MPKYSFFGPVHFCFLVAIGNKAVPDPAKGVAYRLERRRSALAHPAQGARCDNRGSR